MSRLDQWSSNFPGTVNDAFNPGCAPNATGYVIWPYWTWINAPSPAASIIPGPATESSLDRWSNRIFNIEYRTAYYNSARLGPSTINYEVRLYEGADASSI